MMCTWTIWTRGKPQDVIIEIPQHLQFISIYCLGRRFSECPIFESYPPTAPAEEWIFGPIFLVELLIKMAPALEFAGSWAGHALIYLYFQRVLDIKILSR